MECSKINVGSICEEFVKRTDTSSIKNYWLKGVTYNFFLIKKNSWHMMRKLKRIRKFVAIVKYNRHVWMIPIEIDRPLGYDLLEPISESTCAESRRYSTTIDDQKESKIYLSYFFFHIVLVMMCWSNPIIVKTFALTLSREISLTADLFFSMFAMKIPLQSNLGFSFRN